jgi:hypothetical protein
VGLSIGSCGGGGNCVGGGGNGLDALKGVLGVGWTGWLEYSWGLISSFAGFT